MRYFEVDAFTDHVFAGNPAGVCLPDHPLDAATMQAIAAENNLSETAFAVPAADGSYDLRWFTPTVEVDLCGHATLATAFVLARVAGAVDRVSFNTASGTLNVACDGDLLELDFPSRPGAPVDVLPEYAAALGVPVDEAYVARDLMLVVGDEAAVKNLVPDMAALEKLTDFGVIVTAKGDGADFVSRFFAPNAGVPEDPVTGSAHTTLIPFWAARLGKADLLAHQVSRRGGVLYCHDRGDRVGIAGHAVLYMAGEIDL